MRPDQRVDRLPDLRVRQDELLWCDKSDEELSERAGDTERYAQNRDVRDCVAKAAAALPCGRFRRSNVGAGEREPMEARHGRAATVPHMVASRPADASRCARYAAVIS